MNLLIIRYSTTSASTLGDLLIDGDFACYTLEDPYNYPKVYGNTRIPGGIYKLGLCSSGRLHDKYKTEFPGIHKGMLEVLNVPGFEGIMMHIGNKAGDTSGCILLGDLPNNNTLSPGRIDNSTAAYIRIYPKIARALEQNEEVSLLIGEPSELIKFDPFSERT